MPVHRIALRRPWQCERLTDAVRWRRRFGRPTRLGPEERVDLVIQGFSPDATVELNGHCLGLLAGSPPAARFRVTHELQSRNELIIQFESAAAACGPSIDAPAGEVWLEIVSPHV